MTDFIICYSDKSGVMVVLDKPQYKQKINDMLADPNSFMVLRGYQRWTVKAKAIDYVRKLAKLQRITKEQVKTYNFTIQSVLEFIVTLSYISQVFS